MAPKPDFDALAAQVDAALLAAAKKSHQTDADLIALAAADGTPDWLWEILHPKGLDGKFIKKGAGSYIYGHAKTAKFTTKTSTYGNNWTSASVELEPGEKLLKTNNSVAFVQNEHGQAKFWNMTSKTWSKWTDAPEGYSSWEQYTNSDATAGSAKVLSDNPAEASVAAETMDDAVKAVSGLKPTDVTTGSTTPEYIYTWGKTKVMAALTEKKSAKGAGDYLLAQSSFYNPKTTGDAQDNDKSKAQRDALSRLGMWYVDSGYDSMPEVAATNYANFLADNPDYTADNFESALRAADAMDSLAGFIESLSDSADVVQITAVDPNTEKKKKFAPQDYLYAYTSALRAHIAALQASNEPTPEPSAAPKPVEAGLDTTDAVDTPDVAGKKPAEQSVITTKAGPPYGPNVWVTPDFTDPESGQPYLMSSQGEKNAYAVFAPGTAPAIVQNSKGENFDGVSESGLLHVAVNKKSAKAWLAQSGLGAPVAQSDAPAEDPWAVPDSPLADWELELMDSAVAEPEVPAVVTDPSPKNLSEIPEEYVDTFKNDFEDLKKADVYWIHTGGGVMAAAVGNPGSNNLFIYMKSPSSGKVYKSDLTLTAMSADWKKIHVGGGVEKPAPVNPSVDIKFTKVDKAVDGTIEWKVLGAKDSTGGDYSVLSYNGTFTIYDSDATELSVHNSAKAAKAWISEKSNASVAEAEEVPPTEDWPEFAVGLKKTSAEMAAVAPSLKSGDAQKATHLLLLEDTYSPSDSITYGVDENGIVVATSMSFPSVYMGQSSEGISPDSGSPVTFLGENPDFVPAPVPPAIPPLLAGYPTAEFSVPPLPFGSPAKAKFFAHGIGKSDTQQAGAEHYAALDEDGHVIAGTHFAFGGKTDTLDLSSVGVIDWEISTHDYSTVTWGALPYPDSTPTWVESEGLPYIKNPSKTLPFGTAYTLGTKSGQIVGVDSEGFITFPVSMKDDAAGLHFDEFAVYYGPVADTAPNPHASNKVADVSLPNTEETVADNLPEELESPSETNPTPGDPKAHLSVPVVGYKGSGGKTVPGTYLTKKMKNADGKPYLITAEGANKWQVFESETAYVDGDAPLSTHKQLKDAKAWLANGGAASDEPTLSGSDDFFTFEHKGVTVPVFAGSTVLSMDVGDGEKKYYVSSPGDVYVKVFYPNNATVDTIYDNDKSYSTPSKYTAKGLTKVFGPDNNTKPAAVWSAASKDIFDKPTKEFSTNDFKVPTWNHPSTIAQGWNESYWSEATSKANGLYSGIGQITSAGNSASDEQYAEAAKVILGELSKFDWKGAHEYLLARRAQETGSEKTKWTKAVQRLEHDIYLANLVDKVAKGTLTAGDYTQSLTSLGDPVLANTLTTPYQEDYIISFVRGAGMRQWRKVNAKAVGLNPDYVQNDGFVTIPADEVAPLRNMLAEKFSPSLAYLTDQQVKTYFEYAVSANSAMMSDMTKKAADQVATVKSAEQAKAYLAAKKAGEVPAQPLENFDAVDLDFANLSTAANKPVTGGLGTTVKIGDDVYQYGVFGKVWYSSANNSVRISPETMGFLLSNGLAKHNDGGNPVEGPSEGVKWFSSTNDGKPAKWVATSDDLQAMVTAGEPLFGAMDSANPVLLSLIDSPTNPYAGLKDNAFVWKNLYAKVASEMPNLLSGDASSYEYKDYVKTFGLGARYNTSDGSLAPEYQQVMATAWITQTVVPHLEKYAPTSSSGLAVSNLAIVKPFDMDQGHWDIAVAAAYGLDLPAYSDVTPKALGSSFPTSIDSVLTSNPGALDEVPESAMKWYTYATSGKGGFNSSTAVTAFASLAAAGVWTPSEGKTTTEITKSNGTKSPVTVYPGDVIWKGTTDYGDVFHVVLKANGSAQQLSKVYGSNDLKINTLNTSDYFDADMQPKTSTGYDKWEQVYVSPVDFNYEFAKSKIGDFPEASFEIFNDAFLSGKKSFADVDLPHFGTVTQGDSLIYMKNVLSSQKDNPDWATIAKSWNDITPAGKKALHWAHANGNANISQMAALAAKYGMFKPGSTASVIDKNALYYDKVTQGKITLSDIQNNWSALEEQAAAHDLIGVSYTDYWNDTPKYRQELVDFLSGYNNGGTAEKKKPSSMAESLVLHPASFSLGGMHTKGTWADDEGNKWLSKAFGSDPNSQARIDAEHYAMRIGALYGFNPPATGIMKTPDGKVSYVQHYADAAGNLSGFSHSDLSEGALHTAMEQHVLDWIISNHDSHGGNILRTVDGSATYPIDRGQAFKFLGQDKLAVGYLPPGNGESVWYDHVYNAISNNTISKDKADAIRNAVLRKAAIISSRNDEEFRDYVTKALANRTSLPGSFSSVDEMVNYLMQRKASTFDDFKSFYAKVYKSAGYDFGTHEIDDYLPKKVGDAHVTITPDFAEDVLKSSSHGVPLFFGGTEVDNGYAQFFVTNTKSGDQTLRAQFKLMSDADGILQNWLKTQTVEKKSGYGSSYTPAVVLPDHESLPGLGEAHSALVNFVKTVGSHIKKGDYEWNTSTVTMAENYMSHLKGGISAVKAHEMVDPTSAYPDAPMGSVTSMKFVTVEQQDAWLAQAEKMLENFQIVKNAMDTKVSVTQTHPDLVPFVAPSYKATAGIDVTGKPSVKSAYEYAGATYTKHGNGALTKTLSDGTVTKVNKSDFDIAAGHGSMVSTVTAEEDVASTEEVEATVTAGTQIIKVTHQSASAYAGSYDLNKGIVTETGQTEEGLHGMEYLIEVDGVRMRFQSRQDVSVDAQQGLLRLEIDNWTGDTQQIEKALTALRAMGLELNNADEQQLELLYWRQLRATMNKRKLDAKWTKIQSTLNNVNASMSVDEELAAYRAAFSDGYSTDTVDNFVKKKGFLPQIGSFSGNGEVKNGRPWWYRPDMDIVKLKSAANNTLLRHSMHDYGAHESVGKTGFLPTEERFRVLGKWIGGMSSSDDQHKGSSSYLFFRQNQPISSSSVYLEPTEYFRTSNYSFKSDEFGNSKLKSQQSPYDLWKTTNYSNSDNETMVKSGISLLDGMAVMVVYDENTRQKIIQHYADMGVTEIRGIPVSERVVTSTSAARDTIEKVWDYWIKKQNAGETLWASAV